MSVASQPPSARDPLDPQSLITVSMNLGFDVTPGDAGLVSPATTGPKRESVIVADAGETFG